MAEPTQSVDSPDPLSTTPLHDLHIELGGRMVPFAGYDMPVLFEGVVAEHLHTRHSAGLFDVSHMGVVEFHGNADAVGNALEGVMPSAVSTLKPGRQRYSFLTNHDGGIIDDLMVTRTNAGYSAVLNASRKSIDIEHLRANLGGDIEVVPRPDLALLALQGPEAVAILADIATDGESLLAMDFMAVSRVVIDGVDCGVSRSGYTGEDGVELTIPDQAASDLARRILRDDRVRPIGLGARDTLRLEAGLCLYGNDLDTTTSPIEADLMWAIQKRRRTEGGFIGDKIIRDQIANGVRRVRVGILADGKRPVRDHSPLLDEAGNSIGVVTSGGFGPSVQRPVAMGYVPPEMAAVGTGLIADVRGKHVPVTVASLPFAPHRYHRKEA